MNRSWVPRLALITASIIWASHNIAGAWLTFDLHPYFANLTRTTLASLFYLPVIWRYAGRFNFKFTHVPRLLLASACLTCVFFLFFYVALSKTTANHVAMVLAVGPAITAFLARPYLNEPLSVQQILGLSVALISALVLGAMKQPPEATGTWLGGAAALFAAVGFSHYTLLSKPLLKEYPMPLVLGLVTWVGTICLWAVAPFVEESFSWHALSSLLWHQWAVFIYIGLVMNVGSYLLYNYALQHLPASVVHAMTVYSTTIFALLFAQVILHEAISPLHWLCASLIAMGVWVTGRQTGSLRRETSA